MSPKKTTSDVDNFEEDSFEDNNLVSNSSLGKYDDRLKPCID